MAETNKYGPPERVYVELDWYDGPREGIANYNGAPHRFRSLFDEANDEYLDRYLVFPIDSQMLELEKEQWQIFVEWNDRYEKGTETTASHPGHGGINPRWDELESLLTKSRNDVPENAKTVSARFQRIDRERRYDESGPDYMLCWHVNSDDKNHTA